MRRSWPFALAVIVVGALAGVAIAGRPVPSDPFVLDSSSAATESPSSTTEVASTTSNSEPSTTTTVAATSTLPASTTTTAPTTTAAPTTTTVPGPLPRDQVRLVIANGDGRFQLATTTADRIRPLGYIIDLGNVAAPVAETVIYYRPGFDDEAAFAAVDIGVPDALILALPTNPGQPITDSDANGDVIIVLGADAPR